MARSQQRRERGSSKRPHAHLARAWHDAAANEQSRGVHHHTSQHKIIELCHSRSPLRKHIAGLTGTMNLVILQQLRDLPALTELVLRDLKEDEDEEISENENDDDASDSSPYTSEELRDAFPPQLRRLTFMTSGLSAMAVQALLDALPSMPQLTALCQSENHPLLFLLKAAKDRQAVA